MNSVLRLLDRLADVLLSPAARKAVEHGLVRISIVLGQARSSHALARHEHASKSSLDTLCNWQATDRFHIDFVSIPY